MLYRIRIKSDGSAHAKGAWVLYRRPFTDLAKATSNAQALAVKGADLVRVTTATSVKALAEFDGRLPMTTTDQAPGHVRESVTPGSLLPERPELAGLLLADCSCGAEYTAPEGGDESGALEEAHRKHVAAVLLVRESALEGGEIAWQALGPRSALWQIRWEPELPGQNVRAWRYADGRTGFYGSATDEDGARTEALRIAAEIAKGKTRED